MKEKTFTVKSFQWEMKEYRGQDLPTRKLINIKENMNWEEAKKLRKENLGSWIVENVH